MKKRKTFLVPDQRGALGKVLPKLFQYLIKSTSKTWPTSNSVQNRWIFLTQARGLFDG